MAERLGIVLFWCGMLVGIPLIGLGLYAFINNDREGGLVLILAGGSGLSAILFGWALRYILAGR